MTASTDAGVGPAFVWMYVFTLSKFVELFDTAFMIVRRKPVSFLHWYHHTSVLAYTWFAVVVGFCPGWYFATINSGVHTIMYFYYYRSACGVRLTYDRLITTCQLAQMVLGVCITGWWAVMHYLLQDGAQRCPCEEAGSAMASALFMYGSYFLLFPQLLPAAVSGRSEGSTEAGVREGGMSGTTGRGRRDWATATSHAVRFEWRDIVLQDCTPACVRCRETIRYCRRVTVCDGVKGAERRM